MNKELSKAERTRQFIIESTAVVFNKKGYAGTSLADLTEATGLTKGSIYGNFENKEDVALAVFDYNACRTADLVDQHMAQANTFYDKLMVYTKVYSSETLAARGGCAILNTAVEADDTNDLLKNKAAKAVLKWKKKIIDLIEGGIAAGEFKADVNVSQTAISIVALIEGGIMIGKVTGNPANLEQVLKTVELLINQLKA
ncbi:MAG: transcriptional regulator [Mucilaginibacter sp.]|uniref:TetR/AcrR family transcriptional regulator n=1 Tax=Mucilaginibacter sp. TaxID=1882438 RepID=UPI00262A5EE5|nr:TetR/AcrR family transcriptional regulator [Mucilaginibacter sp.]MDB5004532.1 transcriptional regulator [Mucilaginibacter sp.]